MGLFDFFTGDAQKEAADKAAAAARAGYTKGYDQYSGLAGQGRDALSTNYNSAISGYAPYTQSGQQGQGAYLDSLGINGPEGNARAQSMFQASPGFNFALNTGLDAIDRRAASRGMLGSGNTNLDTLKFGTGLGLQDYGNWQNKLQGLGAQGLTAATGQGGLYANLGTGLNNSYTGQGTQAYNTQTGIGNANAGAEIAKGNAETAASGNLWGALFGGAKLAAGAFGGGFGGTGSTGASSLGSFFSPSGSNPFNPDGTRNTMAY